MKHRPVTFSYKDQETPVIEQTATFENERQKVEISVVKQDADTEKAVAGAEFGLYANNCGNNRLPSPMKKKAWNILPAG